MDLTIREIGELARFAGFDVDSNGMEDEQKDEMVTITQCPYDGLIEEDGTKKKYNGHIAYFSEHPRRRVHSSWRGNKGLNNGTYSELKHKRVKYEA